MKFHLPYHFLLKELYPVRPVIRKMLGGYALLVDKKVFLLLREAATNPEFNGVFIAVLPEFYDEMKIEIHNSRMEFDLDGSKNSWIFISEDLPDFKEKVIKACTLIKNNDKRIGKI